MAKGAKTRKQKKLTDLRKKTVHSIEHTAPLIATNVAVTPVSTPTTSSRKNISTIDYHYLRGDLLRTIFLTGTIAIAELFIKFLVKA